MRMTSILCKSRFNQPLLLLAFVIFSGVVRADAPLADVDPSVVTVQEFNPERAAGYVVGDVLERTLVFHIKRPYELVKESLPIVGYEHRWRGQISGIELVNTRHDAEVKQDGTTHTVYLAYQVFSTGRVAKPAALRAEIIKLRNTDTKEVKQYRMPSFNFRISPLSVFGQVKLQEDMAPFHPPLLLDAQPQQQRMRYLALPLVLAILGLIYILGVHAWLPRMGTPFAKAYRDIRKFSDNAEGLKSSVERINHALHQSAGAKVFSHNASQLWQKNPNFYPMQSEIMAFFALSNQVFFESAKPEHSQHHSKAWLLQFCRHMRDCERGLVPHLAKNVTEVKGAA